MLEEKIEALTAAVIELTKAIKAEAAGYNLPIGGTTAPEAEEPVQAEPRKAAKPKAKKAEEPKAESKAPALEYGVVAKKFLEYIAANGREAALEVLEPWDTTSLKTVPAEDLHKVMEKISG